MVRMRHNRVTTVKKPETVVRWHRGRFSPVLANTIDQIGRMRGRPVAETEVETTTWLLANRGREISGPNYVAGVNLIHALGRQVAAQFKDMDLMLTPTMAVPEIPLGHIDAMSVVSTGAWRGPRPSVATPLLDPLELGYPPGR